MKDASLPVKVTVDSISVHSVCKHHMLPFYGTVCVSYSTRGYTLGLSKFKRIVDFTSSELTTQEELTQQIVKHILLVLPVNELQVKVECVHSCMIIRGVKDLHTTTTTEICVNENEL
jgi:GTP cyclohydrolase I